MSEKELHGSWDESMIGYYAASSMPRAGIFLVQEDAPNAFILLALLIALAVMIYLVLRGRSGGDSHTADGSSGYYGGFHDGPGNSDGDPGGAGDGENDGGGSDGGSGGGDGGGGGGD